MSVTAVGEKEEFPVMPTPSNTRTTRGHLRSHHGYPNRVMLRDAITDWEVLQNHVYEHNNSKSSHTHKQVLNDARTN